MMANNAAAEAPEVEDKESPAMAEDVSSADTATASSEEGGGEIVSNTTTATSDTATATSSALASAISEEAEHVAVALHPAKAGEAAIAPEDVEAGMQPEHLAAALHPEKVGEAAIAPKDVEAGKQPEHLAAALEMNAVGDPAMTDQAVGDAPAMAHEAAAAAAAAAYPASADSVAMGGISAMMAQVSLAAGPEAMPAAGPEAAAGLAPASAGAAFFSNTPNEKAAGAAFFSNTLNEASAGAALPAAAASPPLDPEERQRLEHHFLDLAKWYQWTQVKALLDATPDLINVQPARRWSALHQAAEEGTEEMVLDLLARRADTNLITRDGQTPLEVASGRGYIALMAVLHPPKPVVIGPPLSVKVVAQFSGESLGEIECRTSDDMKAFGRAFRMQDPAGPNHSYVVFAGDQKLEPTMTFAEAGVENGATVGVLREKGPYAEVETLDDLWEHRDPGTRYPIVLSSKNRPMLFFATAECRDEDQVEFSNIDIGGGFQRVFINQIGRPTERSCGGEHYIMVYVLSTKKLEVVKIRAGEARFGGIVIQPG